MIWYNTVECTRKQVDTRKDFFYLMNCELFIWVLLYSYLQNLHSLVTLLIDANISSANHKAETQHLSAEVQTE